MKNLEENEDSTILAQVWPKRRPSVARPTSKRRPSARRTTASSARVARQTTPAPRPTIAPPQPKRQKPKINP